MHLSFLQTRGAIVNELYFLTAGGTLWLDEAVSRDECGRMLDTVEHSIMSSSVAIKAPSIQNQGKCKEDDHLKTVD